ncbi:MATE family efflux transporter [Clostridium sp. E02]|uniref:MATE family efflux transporter n=1 Tax=Clostridium sp. E02 TaxID=2487134 RepID=UPI001FA95E3E|nr:MATE family efflux transporter [Clostridium sp. E02]
MKDMTKGRITSQLIRFSIPLILGNLFQLAYNAVDSILVTRFVGGKAAVALATTNPVMSILIIAITGICIGASVLMSEFYGSGDEKRLKDEVSTLLLFGCFFSLIIAAFGYSFSEEILRRIRVPDQLLVDAAKYLRIIFLGMPFTFFYNGVASALRSIGDSKTPVWFLALAFVLNGLLDVVFVAWFHMDVVGAALATDIAEAVSVGLCVFYIYKRVPLLRVSRKEMRLDRDLLILTLRHGVITALQQSCQPIGKLLIQRMINPLGISTIAAFHAVNRVDDFVFVPERSISSGIMTFVAQNKGAKNSGRIKKGFRTGLMIEAGYWIFICIFILIIKKPAMNMFVLVNDSGLVEIGVKYLSLMAFFYLLSAVTNGIQGFFRGMGNMFITLIFTLIQISVGVGVASNLVPVMGLKGVAYASMIGWACMLFAEIPYYFWFKSRNELLQERDR